MADLKRTFKQKRRVKQRAKKASALKSLHRSLEEAHIQLRRCEQKKQLYKRKFDEATGELLDVLKARSTSLKPIATPGVRHCASPALSAVVQHLQTKTIRPTMLQYCPDGIIGEGVFGICRKAYLQGTLVCVKELKNESHHSKSAILHEAQMLSKLCHPSLGWLIAIQIQSIPFQLITPFYGVDDMSISYHDILFKRDCPKLSSVLHYFSSCKDWTELLQDITEGLKHIHGLGLVYRDLKEDNIVLYKAGLMRVHAVLIDFGKCLPESSCTLYSLSHSERETYHKRHRHISPEIVDGTAKPSATSDVYSLGRIIKHTLLHSSVDSDSWKKCLKDICKQSLRYSPSTRPTVRDILLVLYDCLSE